MRVIKFVIFGWILWIRLVEVTCNAWCWLTLPSEHEAVFFFLGSWRMAVFLSGGQVFFRKVYNIKYFVGLVYRSDVFRVHGSLKQSRPTLAAANICTIFFWPLEKCRIPAVVTPAWKKVLLFYHLYHDSLP